VLVTAEKKIKRLFVSFFNPSDKFFVSLPGHSASFCC
jgi:hypothetical protein